MPERSSVHTTSDSRLCDYCHKGGSVIGRATLNGKSAFWHPRCFKKAQRGLAEPAKRRNEVHPIFQPLIDAIAPKEALSDETRLASEGK